MNCQCGFALPDNAKFCPECGQAAPVPEPIPAETVDEILTVNDMLKWLKISRSKLYDMIRRDEIPYFPIGSDKRFIKDDVLAFARGRYKEKFKCRAEEVS